MSKNSFVCVCVCAFVFLVAGLSLPVQAAPLAQLTPFPTPTPGPDGRILYIVQKDDSLWRISAITGVSMDTLRSLNRLDPEGLIREGDILLIGLAGPAEVIPTPGPIPTPGTFEPTPSAQPGTANLCVLLYNDLNGDSMRQEDEPSIPGGAISASNRFGSISLTAESKTGLDPHCFNELPEGEYNVSVAVPGGYNPTTVMNRALSLKGGDETYLAFGAQANSETIVEATLIPELPGRSPLLGILGGVLLVCGLALGVYAGLLVRSRR